MSINCKKLSNILKDCKKHVDSVEKLQKKIEICRKTVKKQSNSLKKCKKILKNIEKSSNMSKTRCKTAHFDVKLATNR